MSYNRNKRIALDEQARLGLRYLSLLRCITHVCLMGNESFKQKLSLLDTGLNSELDPTKASLKIMNSIAHLEGIESLHATGPGVVPASAGLSKYSAASNSERPTLKPGSCVRIINLFGWCISVSANKLLGEDKPLTKGKIEKLFRSEFEKIESVVERESKIYHELVTKKLQHLHEDLAFPPQCRNKSWVSIVDKISRIKYNVESLPDLQDLIGLRVVTIFDKDIEVVARVIERNFNVVRRYSPKYIDGVGGASPLHMVVKRKNSSFFFKEHAASFAILAEVQIMTLAQFSFARVSHSLLYKKDSNHKKNAGNSLKRISALLESVDVELSRIVSDK